MRRHSNASDASALRNRASLKEEEMKRDDEVAIAEFLKEGGRIVKVEPDVPATVAECLEYLANCGVSAKYFPGDPKPYLCQKRRMSVHGLFELANRYRRAEHLQPFAIKHD
jgi:hypothetical protein